MFQIDARIEALQASVDRMLALLAEADDTADLITIESELTARQAELDGLTAQRDWLADQVDYSTLTVELLSEGIAPDAGPDDFWSGLAAGWEALVGFLAGCAWYFGNRGEYVQAELNDGTPLPRIPPLSLMGALEADFEAFNVRGEVEWFDRQAETAPFESATDGFTLVNASIAWRPLRGNDNVTLLLKGENLFDVDARRHASFTKEFVPLAGRNIQASVRFSF